MELKKINMQSSVDATVETEKYTYNVTYRISGGQLTEVQIGVRSKVSVASTQQTGIPTGANPYRGTVNYNNGAVVQTLVGDTTLDERVLIMQEAEQVYKLVAAEISVL